MIDSMQFFYLRTRQLKPKGEVSIQYRTACPCGSCTWATRLPDVSVQFFLAPQDSVIKLGSVVKPE